MFSAPRHTRLPVPASSSRGTSITWISIHYDSVLSMPMDCFVMSSDFPRSSDHLLMIVLVLHVEVFIDWQSSHDPSELSRFKRACIKGRWTRNTITTLGSEYSQLGSTINQWVRYSSFHQSCRTPLAKKNNYRAPPGKCGEPSRELRTLIGLLTSMR